MESNGLPPEKNEKRVRSREWLILLLALLLSFGCVFCSSGFALTFWTDRMSPASLLAGSQADYSRDRADGVRFAVLDPLVVAQAIDDVAHLQMTPTGSHNKNGVVIASLPATPTPTANPDPRPLLPTVSCRVDAQRLQAPDTTQEQGLRRRRSATP